MRGSRFRSGSGDPELQMGSVLRPGGLSYGKASRPGGLSYSRRIVVLEQLLASLMPKDTALEDGDAEVKNRPRSP